MRVLGTLVLCLCSVPLAAQPAAGGQSAPTVAPVWDVRNLLEDLAVHADRLLQALERVDVKAWSDQGASETYAAQLRSCKEQAKALSEGARQLAHKPEVLSTGLELYIRITALDNMTHSLEEGIRKYQNPAVAEMLTSVAASGSANRDGFQRYLVELAAEREQQLGVMDREAQRCRGMLARQPVEIPKKSGRNK